MNIDTTDPEFITALAKACALTPTPSLIAQALREVIDAEREACLRVAVAVRDKYERLSRAEASPKVRNRVMSWSSGAGDVVHAIRRRGGK